MRYDQMVTMNGYWFCSYCDDVVSYRAPLGRWDAKTGEQCPTCHNRSMNWMGDGDRPRRCDDCKGESITIQRYANGVTLCDDCLQKRQFQPVTVKPVTVLPVTPERGNALFAELLKPFSPPADIKPDGFTNTVASDDAAAPSRTKAGGDSNL